MFLRTCEGFGCRSDISRPRSCEGANHKWLLSYAGGFMVFEKIGSGRFYDVARNSPRDDDDDNDRKSRPAFAATI